MKKIILFKNLYLILLSSILLCCYASSDSSSIATFTLINTSCSDCHTKLMNDITNIPGVNQSDGFISQDSNIVIINISYNAKVISVEEINDFIISNGFSLYSK